VPTAALDRPVPARLLPGPDRSDITISNGLPGTGPIDSITLTHCREAAGPFAKLAECAACEAGVDYRALRVRALLHLPRVATFSGRVTRKQIERELWHSARLLRVDAATVEPIVPRGIFALQEFTFAEDFDPVIAGELFSSLHYLRSARAGPSISHSWTQCGSAR
jgi:hypothetical protein